MVALGRAPYVLGASQALSRESHTFVTEYACWFQMVRVPTELFALSPNTVIPRWAR